MKWIYFVLALLFFILFVIAFDTTILVIRTNWKWQQKVKSIFLIWLIPVYGIYLVRSRIRVKREIDYDESDDSAVLPLSLFDFGDNDSDDDFDIDYD